MRLALLPQSKAQACVDERSTTSKLRKLKRKSADLEPASATINLTASAHANALDAPRCGASHLPLFLSCMLSPATAGAKQRVNGWSMTIHDEVFLCWEMLSVMIFLGRYRPAPAQRGHPEAAQQAPCAAAHISIRMPAGDASEALALGTSHAQQQRAASGTHASSSHAEQEQQAGHDPQQAYGDWLSTRRCAGPPGQGAVFAEEEPCMPGQQNRPEQLPLRMQFQLPLTAAQSQSLVSQLQNEQRLGQVAQQPRVAQGLNIVNWQPLLGSQQAAAWQSHPAGDVAVSVAMTSSPDRRPSNTAQRSANATAGSTAARQLSFPSGPAPLILNLPQHTL